MFNVVIHNPYNSSYYSLTIVLDSPLDWCEVHRSNVCVIISLFSYCFVCSCNFVTIWYIPSYVCKIVWVHSYRGTPMIYVMLYLYQFDALATRTTFAMLLSHWHHPHIFFYFNMCINLYIFLYLNMRTNLYLFALQYAYKSIHMFLLWLHRNIWIGWRLKRDGEERMVSSKAIITRLACSLHL